jgi:hypothetical protein
MVERQNYDTEEYFTFHEEIPLTEFQTLDAAIQTITNIVHRVGQ